MSSSLLQEQAKQHALKAVECDRIGQLESAIFYYLEASQALFHLKNEQNNQIISAKLNEYISRAEHLKKQLNSQQNQATNSPKFKTEQQKEIEKGLCLLSEAVDQDSDGNLNEAFELYTNAVELFIKIPNKNQIASSSREAFQRLARNIDQALLRAEEIKKLIKKSESSNQLNQQQQQQQKPPQDDSIWQQDLDKLNLNDSNDEEEKEPIENLSNLNRSSTRAFSKDEIAVLRRGSFINQRNYVPFFPEVDRKEKFYFAMPFTDKDGKLALSHSQRERFTKWVRPDEIYENPTLMMLISSFSVKQTCISDCSFVASLTVCAQYERKFGKSLLSQIIYPQNKKGEPIYNPCGKYMISLNLNGCQRKIVIDDYLPIDNHNQLLCSQTTNRGELWVSLLEKAYMKVMGGYDFPGSNSNIDLHCLTNWIPERISIHGEHTDFDKNADFERMFERLHSGDCLITIATGQLSKDEENRTGLVPTHAYAVLDIRKFKEKRLLQLKNPWSHLRWKGNFSEYDITNWTSELKNALNYDPQLACNVDNGIFWIDYESLLRFFDVFYLSWNPNLFPHTTSFHRKWSANEGPIKDRYNLGENPQYLLKVKTATKAANKRCTTWILLTRHIVDKADFAENKEYIALVVYKASGKRIYYPMEPPPYKEGIRINSPHYLVKLVDDEPGPIVYTLVISQYEKYNSIYYTLKTYSTQPFDLSEIREPYKAKYHKKISGKWDSRTAGGCSNYRDTYKNNPQYQLTLANTDTNNCIKIELKGPQQYSVGFDLICANSNVPNSQNNFKQTSTGDFRKGFCVLPMNNICGGTYTIRPMTYMPGQEGPFFLEISSNREYIVNQIQ